MPVVFDNLLHPGEGQVGFNVLQRVDLYLVASADDSAAPGWASDTHDLTFIDKRTAYANGAGYVEFDLWPNSVITPSNTYYAWATHLLDGRVSWRYFRVPNLAGPFWVNDLLIASPDPLQAAFGTAAAVVSRVANQVISNTTLTTLAFDTSVYAEGDTALWDAGTPGRLVAPVDGEYLFGGESAFAANSTGNRQSSIRVNNTYIPCFDTKMAVVGDITVTTLSGFYPMTAGQYIEWWLLQNSGGSLNCTGHMWMKRVG